MVSVAGSGSRQDEEALAASALLDLATPVPLIDNKTSVITSNPTLSSYNRNLSHPQHQKQSHEKETKQGPNGIVGEKDGLVHLMVTSNAQGQRVLQLPNGMEFLFDPRPGTTPPSSITLPSSLLNGTLLSGGVSSSAGPAESGRQYAVIDLSKKRVKQETEQDGNNNSIRMDQENPLTMCPNHHHHPHQQQQTSFSSTSSSSQEVVSTGSVPPVHLLPPNVLHFLPQGNHMNTGSGVYCDNGRRSFSSGSSSCSSVDGSESCCSSSGGGGGILISSNSSHTSGIKKRGRKRLYDHCSDQMLMHQQHAPSNPIKEFRQRQRVRERQEDERLGQLETRYKNSGQLMAMPLDQLYDSRGLNMKFPRVKTAMKRGKAADDSERTNRKKECARRDSKNYRERAKAKRDLIVKKIAFLEDLLKSISAPKYQYVF